MTIDLNAVDQAVARLGRSREALIPLLQAVQDHYGYLPEAGLRRVCELTQITPAAMTGVSSFYDMFRTQPVGRHVVRVCRGTACHVAGADRIEDALRQHLGIPAGEDTDRDREFTLESVSCLGCCTLAPVLKVGPDTMGHATTEGVPSIVETVRTRGCKGNHESTETLLNGPPTGAEIRIGLGSCCMAKGSDQIYHALRESVAQSGADVTVKRVGCVGMCHRTPLVELCQAGGASALYEGLDASRAPEFVKHHFGKPSLLSRAQQFWNRALDAVLTDTPTHPSVEHRALNRKQPEIAAFLDRQVHIATEGFGNADPLDLDEYVKQGGFEALKRQLQPPGADIIGAVEQSGLRGRGGAGFPTGKKWRMVAAQDSETKYVVCNGDEGDPGAFMDRMILESFPFRVIEGLLLSAVAVGAHEGVFYIRHEYPLAVQRVRSAIQMMQARGWLGERLLGLEHWVGDSEGKPERSPGSATAPSETQGYRLHLRIVEGAGAFVCGEETALIASIEGKRGMPRLRPPFPAQEGLWGKPTLINNVETLSVVPWILRNGADQFAAYGTHASKGTKVFALAGRIQRAGLIEVPMGTTLREIVEEIGGGVEPGRRLKAVQIGGPSGGCVPAWLADTPVDYESLKDIGAIMGSGGLVVLDDTTCMVDIARYFLEFTQRQSCGKCTFCRIGTKRMLDLMDRFCSGKGRPADLGELETLAHQVGGGSLCGLGKTAPNPVLSTLRYFRGEYEAHIQGRCPAGKCAALVHYRITDECTGCTLCSQACPVGAIPMTPYRQHQILDDQCTRCDACRQACPHNAVEVR